MTKSVQRNSFLLTAIISACSIQAAHAAVLNVSSINITAGHSWANDPNGVIMSNPYSISVDKTITPYTVFAANTNFVGGPLEQVIGFNWFGSPVTTFTNVSGTTVPTVWIDTSTNKIYADMSAWYYQWGFNSPQFSGTGVMDPWISSVASGDWNPLTNEYSLSWNSLYCTSPNPGGCQGQWNISGTASVVPVPAAAVLFGSGVAGLLGIAGLRRNFRRSITA